MEYIVSNRNFDGASKEDEYYYTGNINKNKDGFFIFEGYCKTYKISDFKLLDIENVKLNSLEGVFNLIYLKKDKIIITNDKLGQIPVYYWFYNKEFIISNNFWSIIKLLSSKEIKLDLSKIKEQIYFYNTVVEGSTYIENIKIHKAATQAIINFKENSIVEKKYWEFTQKPDNSLSLNEIVDGIDSRINNHFKYIKDNFSDKKIAFGNSGGLDSRIIPHYARKNNLEIFGITIGNDKAGFLGKPTSFKNADNIAKLLNFKTYHVPYNSGGFNKQMLLDIRNNPLGGSQLFKNPLTGYPDIDIFLCGGNGYTIAYNDAFWGTYSETKDIMKKKEGFIRNFSTEKFLIKYSKKNKLNNFFDKKINNEENELLKKIFTNDDINNMHNSANKFVDEYKNIDAFSFVRIIQTRLFNRFSPMGGYESINRKTFPMYLYYPSILEYSQTWPEEIFYNKGVLKALIKKIHTELSNIPDQGNNIIGKQQNKYYKKIKNYLQKTGIDYKLMFNNKEFQEYANTVLKRKNPLMEDVWDYINNKFDYNNNFNLLSLKLLKTKKILDIIYYREFDELDDEIFKIKSL